MDLVRMDDFVRSSLLDPIYGFETNKCLPNYCSIPESLKAEVAKLIKAHVFIENNDDIRQNILEILTPYFSEERLKTVVNNYMLLFDVRSGFTAVPCHDFDMEFNLGLKLIATRMWMPGQLMATYNLCSYFERLEPYFNPYSVSNAHKKKSNKVWLGPCAIVNHSCNPNATYHTVENQTIIQVLSPISIGEEITVNYGPTFFPSGACKCATCKLGEEKEQTETERRKPRIPDSSFKPKHTRETFDIYSKIFAKIEYPAHLQVLADHAERYFIGNVTVVTEKDVYKMMADMQTDVTNMGNRIDVFGCMAGLEDPNRNLLSSALQGISYFTEIGKLALTKVGSDPGEIKEVLSGLHTFLGQITVDFELRSAERAADSRLVNIFKEGKKAHRERQLEDYELVVPDIPLILQVEKPNTPEEAIGLQADHELGSPSAVSIPTTEPTTPITSRSTSKKKRQLNTGTVSAGKKVRKEESPSSESDGEIAELTIKVKYRNGSSKVISVNAAYDSEQPGEQKKAEISKVRDFLLERITKT
ncbi:hypothetical protein GCK72_024289 [Caenorhabditis remanei]|uniref:SET domain-containing protein n=1 Tax=Caenorhabditis remanei TaxID=31234 RepID=A0A6A5FZ41_CAERE|nr:hypothetical protein GCK72_024289 [Caenorhabditis remanei]KAF1747823.1 hypothetical protein GCK72_024289 [Caenorhabditis remanei]